MSDNTNRNSADSKGEKTLLQGLSAWIDAIVYPDYTEEHGDDFNYAWHTAVNNGHSKFIWNGKTYSTEWKKPGKKTKDYSDKKWKDALYESVKNKERNFVHNGKEYSSWIDGGLAAPANPNDKRSFAQAFTDSGISREPYFDWQGKRYLGASQPPMYDKKYRDDIAAGNDLSYHGANFVESFASASSQKPTRAYSWNDNYYASPGSGINNAPYRGREKLNAKKSFKAISKYRNMDKDSEAYKAGYGPIDKSRDDRRALLDRRRAAIGANDYTKLQTTFDPYEHWRGRPADTIKTTSTDSIPAIRTDTTGMTADEAIEELLGRGKAVPADTTGIAKQVPKIVRVEQAADTTGIAQQVPVGSIPSSTDSIPAIRRTDSIPLPAYSIQPPAYSPRLPAEIAGPVRQSPRIFTEGQKPKIAAAKIAAAAKKAAAKKAAMEGRDVITAFTPFLPKNNVLPYEEVADDSKQFNSRLDNIDALSRNEESKYKGFYDSVRDSTNPYDPKDYLIDRAGRRAKWDADRALGAVIPLVEKQISHIEPVIKTVKIDSGKRKDEDRVKAIEETDSAHEARREKNALKTYGRQLSRDKKISERRAAKDKRRGVEKGSDKANVLNERRKAKDSRIAKRREARAERRSAREDSREGREKIRADRRDSRKERREKRKNSK